MEDARSLGATLRLARQGKGYAVDLAANGVDGLWRPTEFDSGAVVLDLMLLGLDGLRVCGQLPSPTR